MLFRSMQIMEKYSRDYETALERFRETRREMMEELSRIKGLRVIPSQANYCMVEILSPGDAGTGGSRELTRKLLLNHGLLIKDLSGKIPAGRGQYVRLAVKTREENRKLWEALGEYFGQVQGEEG